MREEVEAADAKDSADEVEVESACVGTRRGGGGGVFGRAGFVKDGREGRDGGDSLSEEGESDRRLGKGIGGVPVDSVGLAAWTTKLGTLRIAASESPIGLDRGIFEDFSGVVVEGRTKDGSD